MSESLNPSGSFLSERTLLTPDHRDFWEKLSGWVAPAEDGGGIDMFSPLAASGRWTQMWKHTHTQTHTLLWNLNFFVCPSIRSGSGPDSLYSDWTGGSSADGSRHRKFPEQ